MYSALGSLKPFSAEVGRPFAISAGICHWLPLLPSILSMHLKSRVFLSEGEKEGGNWVLLVLQHRTTGADVDQEQSSSER